MNNAALADTAPGLLSAVDLAQRFHVSVTTIYSWRKRGTLPPPRRLGRSCRWLWSDVATALAALPVAQRED